MLCDLIYKYTSIDGFCDKTLTDLAEELNSSSRTMSRYINELTDKGTLENIGTKAHPKFRTTPLWFRVAILIAMKQYLLSIKKYVVKLSHI